MRLRRAKTGNMAECDMTPMIDMTFQLIAFFMVALNFSEAEQDERIKLPTSALARPPEGAVDNLITIQITHEGNVLYGGEVIPLEGIHRYLISERDILRLNGKSAADATVVIRADAGIPVGKVQELIQICQSEQFERFALRAKEELD